MTSSTAIGSASVVLTANADGLAAGLDKAAGDVDKWARDVEKKAGAAGGGGGLLGKILGGAKGLAGGGLGLLAGAAGGLMAAVEDAPKKLKELAHVGKQADAVGVASDRYMGLAAALEGDAVNTVLGRVAKLTEGAAAGGSLAQETLSKLGLTAQDLAGQSLDKQFIL